MKAINPLELIRRYYSGNPDLEKLLVTHSKAVADRALAIADRHPEFGVDRDFLYEAAMLHDIGILYVDAPAIHCHGTHPYIQHGILGAALLRQEGLEDHARVAERHTGTGLTAAEIQRQGLPLPVADYTPKTMAEKMICYADKFYSKSRPNEEKSYEQAARSLAKFGIGGLQVFEHWRQTFG